MLTAKKIEKLQTPGRYRDGLVKGLYLQVGEAALDLGFSGTNPAGARKCLGSAPPVNLR
jgi:hypothetical protein